MPGMTVQERWRQEDLEFKVSLDYIVRQLSKKEKLKVGEVAQWSSTCLACKTKQ
jgi:hypothetical protein